MPSAAQRSRGLAAWQSLSVRQALGVQIPHCFVQIASCWQSALEPHWGVQKPWPPESWTQCCVVVPMASKQSWSVWHGAQYRRGRQTAWVGPKLGFVVFTFGATLTVAHHHPPGQSRSRLQSNIVQNALASVGEMP